MGFCVRSLFPCYSRAFFIGESSVGVAGCSHRWGMMRCHAYMSVKMAGLSGASVLLLRPVL